MAINFKNIASSFTSATRQLNSVATGIQPLTGAIAQGAGRTQGLASQAGNVNVNAREITNGFQQAGQSSGNIPNITNQINNLSGFGNVNVNQILSTTVSGLAGGPLGQLGAIGNVVSNFTNTISGVTGAVQSLRSGTGLSDLTALIGGFDVGRFATNIINVVPKDFAELAFSVGGEFDAIRQRVAAIGDASNLEDFINLTFTPQGSSPRIFGDSEADVATDDAARNRNRNRIPNPLRNHNSFNYVVSLACMTVQENNFPEVYREGVVFNQYIIRSSGGFYENRYQVLDELGDESGQGVGHAEYYIDDLEIDAVIAPNQNTRVAMGTTIRFTVTEPYSMGNFIEAIVGSVKEKSTSPLASVNGWPFCLQIDFVGYNEFGERSQKQVRSPIFIPINIINMELNVTGQGSVYDVQAVAYPETALSDSINQIFTDVEATGMLIHEVLNGETDSVIFAINDRIDNLEANDIISAGDRFIIAFPQDINDMTNAIREMTPTPDTIRTSVDIAGIGPQPVQEVRNPSSQMFENLMAYARNVDKMNEIGNSFIVEDASEGGSQPMGNPSEAHPNETDTLDPTASSMQVSTNRRTYPFGQGERITDIIEDIVVRSRYAADKATEESAANGTRQWFKIVTQVYLDNTAQAIAERGRPARIYVYSVILYFPDEAKSLGTGENPKNTQGLKDSAVKEYNYIYTGLNEDILEFDLTFNNAFFQTALANYNMNPGAEGHLGDATIADPGSNVSTGAAANAQNNDVDNKDVTGAVEETRTDGRNIGTRSRDVKLQVAKMFHDRLINQPTDLITAEMKILGDPFFLPQQTGNYIGGSTSNPNLTADGTVAYMENEVFLVVNFNTPFDYQIEGATMEFPKIVPQFSGLFSCWAVTNNFSKGRFEQTLKLIRRTGQDNVPTDGNKGPTTVDDARTIVTPLIRATFNADGTVTGSGQSARPGSRLPPVVRAGGVTFDPRTDVFQPPSRVIDTPAGRQTIQPPPINIYDDAIFRTIRNQVTPSAPRPPVNSTGSSNDPNRVGPR